MKRTSALSGIVGIVFLLFAGLGFILTTGGFARLFSDLNLFAGIIAVIGWLVSSRGSLGTMAERAPRVSAPTRQFTAWPSSAC